MIKILAPLSLAVLLAGCSEPAPPPAVIPLVTTLTVGTGAAAAARAYSGEVRARYEIPLAFRVGGKLIERRVDAGAKVARGQALARLDPADLRLQAGQAEAQRALAEADARRYRDLRARNFVSQAALDAREAALTAAHAQAGVAANQAAYATLAADDAGVIAAVLAEPGQVVAPGQAVLRLARDGEREVALSLPESALAELAPGAPAEVTLFAGGRNYRGRLREIAPAADPATRTFAARVSLPDAEADLPLGQSATVRFGAPAQAATQPPQPLVPLAALFQQGERHAVWIVSSDQTVSLRPVRIAAYADQGALVAEGLAPGERIVAAGVHKLTAGQKIRLAETRP